MTGCVVKVQSRRFEYLIQNDKDLDFQFLPCCSTLCSKHKAQVQLQVFIPFCKSAVTQLFRGSGCNASFNQELPPWSAEPLLSHPGSTLSLTTHTQTFSSVPVMQIGTGSQLIIKITLLGLRAQSGTGGCVRHAQSNG